MSQANSSSGESGQEHLQKITPKDLVMFSPKTRNIIAKNDFSYLNVDYDLNLPKDDEEKSIKVWGLPYAKITDPWPLGFLSGFGTGALLNMLRARPPLASVQLHLALSVFAGFTIGQVYKKMDEIKIKRELAVWDYVKRYPQDFPEVFNPPKKYRDLLVEWKPVR